MHAKRKVEELKSRLVRVFSDERVRVHAVSAHVNPGQSNFWPDDDVCVVAKCASHSEYYDWLGPNRDALKAEAETLTSLTVVPQISSRLIAPFAFRVFSIGLIPEEEFAKKWTEHFEQPCFTSPTFEAFDQALSNMMNAYAALELLQDKKLLNVERDFVEACREKLRTAMRSLDAACEKTPTPMMTEVTQFLVKLQELLKSGGKDEKPAVQVARQLLPMSTSDRPSELMGTVLGIRVLLIQHDLDRLTEPSA
jgi:hypothetical protein